IGVDSVMCPLERRRGAWRRLASDLDAVKLAAMTSEIGLSGGVEAGRRIVEGGIRGRIGGKIGESRGTRWAAGRPAQMLPIPPRRPTRTSVDRFTATLSLPQIAGYVLGADLNCSESRRGRCLCGPPNDSIHRPHEPGHCGILVLVDLMNAFSLGGSEPVRPRADIRTVGM